MLLGCNTWAYNKDAVMFRKYFTSLFNFATLPFYTYQVVAEEGQYDFARRDEILEWCESNNIIPKGHPLWFGHQYTNPQWMFGKSYKELSNFAREYIKKNVTRFCCKTVRESDPDAISIINVCLHFGEYVAGRFVCYGPVFEQPISPLAFFKKALDQGIDFG